MRPRRSGRGSILILAVAALLLAGPAGSYSGEWYPPAPASRYEELVSQRIAELRMRWPGVIPTLGGAAFVDNSSGPPLWSTRRTV